MSQWMTRPSQPASVQRGVSSHATIMPAVNPDFATQIGGVSSSLSNFLNRITGALSSGSGAITQGAVDFNESFNKSATPVLEAFTNLGRTVESLGYMGMAIDKKGSVLPGPSAIESGRGVQSSVDRAYGQMDENTQRLSDIQESAREYDPEEAGYANYQDYLRAKEEEQNKRRKRKKKKPRNRGRTSYKRRR